MNVAQPHQLDGRPGWYYRVKDPSRGDQWVRLKGGDTYEEAVLAGYSGESRDGRGCYVADGCFDKLDEAKRLAAEIKAEQGGGG